jgi:hypothetical protein
MARQGGWVQLEQYDMCLALNMAEMAKGGFSCAAIVQLQQLINIPYAEVGEEKNRGVESAGRNKVKAAIKKTPGNGSRKSNGRHPTLPKWHWKKSTDPLEAQRHGCNSTMTLATSAWNTTWAI